MATSLVPLKIRVDDNFYQKQQITINGITLFLIFTFNTAYKTDNWVMDIQNSDGEYIYTGKRITATTNLTSYSQSVVDILGGYLFCVNTRGIREPISKDNFGTNKNYQIWYFSNAEVARAESTA